MENATKALLIAAAVLIAILLISLGVGVFNTASEQMGNADLSEYEIQKFNDKFSKYEGKNLSGSDVNAMLKTIFNHYLSQEDSNMRVRVSLDYEDDDDWLIRREGFNGKQTYKKVSTGKRYTVKAHYGDKTKLIDQIDVTTNK